MAKAGAGQRFVAWLIDTIITTIVISLFLTVIMMITKTEMPEKYDEPSDKVISLITDYEVSQKMITSDQTESIESMVVFVYMLQDGKTEIASYMMNQGASEEVVTEFNAFYDTFDDYMTEYSQYLRVVLLVGGMITLIVFFAYYNILAYYWSKQTVGRMLMKIKVADEFGQKPRLSSLILRDTVGFLLFNLLNICCFVPAILNIIFICGRNQQSVGDKLSYLQMVRYDEASMPTNEANHSDSINAEATETTVDNSNEE